MVQQYGALSEEEAERTSNDRNCRRSLVRVRERNLHPYSLRHPNRCLRLGMDMKHTRSRKALMGTVITTRPIRMMATLLQLLFTQHRRVLYHRTSPRYLTKNTTTRCDDTLFPSRNWTT